MSAATPIAPEPEAVYPLKKKHKIMIAFFDLDLNEIAKSSGDYPWPCPCACGRCGHPKLWGHGLVAMIFEGFTSHPRGQKHRGRLDRALPGRRKKT